MLSTDELFTRVVADGARRRQRRRGGWLAGLSVAALVVGAVTLRSPDGPGRTTVAVAAPLPSTTVVIPAPTGGREVRVPKPLPPMPAEAPFWSAVAPDAAVVQTLANALGVGGTVVAAADGFTINGGNTVLRVSPANGVAGWRFVMDPCPVGRCRPPDVRPMVPVPTVEVRDAPDHPPFDAAPVAAEAARRIATVVGNVAIPHLTMSLAEWWAEFSWLAGDVAVRWGFTAYVQPDGSVRMADGFLDRPGEPGPLVRLAGVEKGLSRLGAAPLGGISFGGCIETGCGPLVVTGVRMGLDFAAERFIPAYVFTLDDGSERSISAV